MAPMARTVGRGMPHHIAQQGNRRTETFFRKGDYGAYLELIKTWRGGNTAPIQAYGLMPDHVHLIAAPEATDGLARAMGGGIMRSR